jgi:putative membrane protein
MPRTRAKGIGVIAYIGGVLGLALLIYLMIRADLAGMLRITVTAGWPLLWLLPYRGLFYLLYAWGWLNLVRPVDRERRVSFPFLLWVTAVREAIDRLLPVASLGGSIVGVRLLRWRDLETGAAASGVIIEIILTFIATYLFTICGLLLLFGINDASRQYDRVLWALILSLPAPVLTFALLRNGAVFTRIEKYLRPLAGLNDLSAAAPALDRNLRAALSQHTNLITVTLLHLLALLSGSFEIWLALRLFAHPVSAAGAVIMESMCQAMRTAAFLVPAGLGVQEAGLVIFGHLLGVSTELALAVSLAKRLREVLCGIPALASWQWAEGRRLRNEWVR